MKLVLISDTHNEHSYLTSNKTENFLPEGDLLIHAGDFSGQGKQKEVENFLEWCVQIEKKYTHGIVFIAGNHDRSFDSKIKWYEAESNKIQEIDSRPKWLVDILSDIESTNSIHYLEDSSITIDGINIWGSPITPWFHGDYWAFNKHRGSQIQQTWDLIPKSTDIVVTHGPVAYKLDYIPNTREYVGCEDLRKAIDRIQPLVFVSGHIHESYGYEYDTHTNYFNASICTGYYDPTNKPWEVTVDWQEKTLNF